MRTEFAVSSPRGAERRQFGRRQTYVHARIHARGRPSVPCIMRDISEGGALLQGLDRRVSQATQMRVHVADDPLTCVARGTGKALEELDVLERTLVAETYSHSPR